MTGPTALNLMTFNIRGALYDDGMNHWRTRAPLNVQLIRQIAPDLIGFQELHLATYTERLPEYEFFLGKPYNDNDPFQYPAIFWNPRRLKPTESGGFWLSQTPDRHSRSWETACIRSAAWVKFEWLAAGLSFLHLNTHLDHVSETARIEGARLILRTMQEQPLPQIITGDFNCIPGTQTYLEFVQQGFTDAFLAAGGQGRQMTYHAFQGAAYVPKPHEADRIDWILLRGWNRTTGEGTGVAVESCIIVRDGYPLDSSPEIRFPSDHYPVVTQITRNYSSSDLEDCSHPTN